MKSQAGTHAICPTGTWQPVLWNTNGFKALRRIATSRSDKSVSIFPCQARRNTKLLTFIQWIQPNGLFDEAIEKRKLTDCFAVQTVFNFFDLLPEKLNVLGPVAQLEKYEVEVLTLSQSLFVDLHINLPTIHG